MSASTRTLGKSDLRIEFQNKQSISNVEHVICPKIETKQQNFASNPWFILEVDILYFDVFARVRNL